MSDPTFPLVAPSPASWRDWLPWRPWPVAAALTVLFVVAGVPLFLRMPLWCDISLYDVAARTVLTGGVHYRDVFDTNLPGYVWLLAGVRAVVGWSSEALRAVDLAVFAATLVVLDRFAVRGGATRRTRWWAVAGACGFYLFSSEFVHAQRDAWLGLPALLAVFLRVRRAVAGTDERLRGGAFLAGAIEGVLWAAAVWIKPHVLVVAAPVWLATARRLACRHERPWRAFAGDFLGNLVGGGLIGAAGVAALVTSGTWPYFWDVMTEWNPAYSRKAFIEMPFRLERQLFWFPPWSWFLPFSVVLSLLAILDARLWSGRFRDGDASPARWVLRNAVVAALTLVLAPYRLAVLFLVNPLAPFVPEWVWTAGRWVAGLLHDPTTSDRLRYVRGGLGVLYLTWTAQAFFLQRGFHYVHVTETVLMMALWSAHRWCLPALVFAWLAVTSVVMAYAVPGTPLRTWIDRFERIETPGVPYDFFVRHPLTDPDRMRHWGTCVRLDLTRRERTELANALRFMGDHEASTNWAELDEVADFLVARRVGDREVVAWHDSTHPLYLLLGVKPGTRFMHVNTAASIDPDTSPGVVIAELNANRAARFVVADIESMAYFSEEAYELPNARSSWWGLPTDPLAPPLPPAPVRVAAFADFEFPFDRNPTLTADSPKRYPYDRRPVVFRSRGGTGRYVVFALCQPIRAVFERP